MKEGKENNIANVFVLNGYELMLKIPMTEQFTTTELHLSSGFTMANIHDYIRKFKRYGIIALVTNENHRRKYYKLTEKGRKIKDHIQEISKNLK